MHQVSEMIVPEGAGAGFVRHAKQPNLMELTVPAHGTALVTGRCGDAIAASVVVEDGVLAQVRLEPLGCVYTLVCASALTGLVRGLTPERAVAVEPERIVEELDGLPEDHHHCARLAVNSLIEAIADYYQRQRSTLRPKGDAHAHT